MELYEAMTTAGAARAYQDRAVDPEILYRILDKARFAPSGGNQQGWRVIVVRDPSRKKSISELYRAPWDAYVAALRKSAEGVPNPRLDRSDRFAQNLDKVPVQLLLWTELDTITFTDDALERPSITGGASVYPFAHNVLLACRQEGLGATLTTMLVPQESAVRVVVGAPESWALAALITIGYPEPGGGMNTRLNRRPVEEFAFVETAHIPFTG